MGDLRLRLQELRKADYRSKTFFFSALSALMGIGFALLNAVLGVVYQSVWNGSICVYYILLAAVRGVVVLSQREGGAESANPERDRKVFVATHVVMIVMDLALVAPIAYMVMGTVDYRFGLIPAIAMAAYVTYRVAMSAYQFGKSRKHESLLVRELRVINLQDALVALIVLQNALIIAYGSSASSMIALTGWTSAGIWALIVFFTVRSFLGVTSTR